PQPALAADDEVTELHFLDLPVAETFLPGFGLPAAGPPARPGRWRPRIFHGLSFYAIDPDGGGCAVRRSLVQPGRWVKAWRTLRRGTGKARELGLRICLRARAPALVILAPSGTMDRQEQTRGGRPGPRARSAGTGTGLRGPRCRVRASRRPAANEFAT